MSKFIIFYNINKKSKKIIQLIENYKLNNLFKTVKITENKLKIYQKYLQTIPILIVNTTNKITNYNKILEFIIRIHINLNKIIPYVPKISLDTNYYSEINKSDNIDYYSSTYCNYNSNIPEIITDPEEKTLNIENFNKEYKKIINYRNSKN